MPWSVACEPAASSWRQKSGPSRLPGSCRTKALRTPSRPGLLKSHRRRATTDSTARPPHAAGSPRLQKPATRTPHRATMAASLERPLTPADETVRVPTLVCARARRALQRLSPEKNMTFSLRPNGHERVTDPSFRARVTDPPSSAPAHLPYFHLLSYCYNCTVPG